MKKRIIIIPLLFLFVFLFSIFFTSCGQQEQADTSKLEQQLAGLADKIDELAKKVEKFTQNLKAGFVYIGPVGDYGWSHAHDTGRRFAEEELPWLETIIVESVSESDLPGVMNRLVQKQQCDVIFTTSFNYMEETIKAGKRYPENIFMHCSGFKRSDNVGTYFGDLYQMYYLNGIMAGTLTKTDKIGYVATFPIPEIVRHIDAYALGIKTANPKATLSVKWIYAWYGHDKAKEAAEALIAEGCDTLAFSDGTPVVIEVGQSHSEKGKQIYTFSHYSEMQPYGIDSVVSGQLMDWGVIYVKILESIHNGTWTNEDIWWLAKEKAALLGGSKTDMINPKFVQPLKDAMVDSKELGTISAYDLVVKRYEQMKQGAEVFEPFTGPIKDNQGNLRIKAGEKASKSDLLSIMYYVDNVEGSIPK